MKRNGNESRVLELIGKIAIKEVKKETGKSAQEYIQNILIETAKDRLYDTSQSISEIAYGLGFQYPQHFSRMFKKSVGYTPNEYRQQN